MAQSTSGDLAIDQYRPSPFSDRGLELDGTTVLPFGQYRIGADVDIARRALILEETQPGIFQGTASGAEHALISLGVGASLGAVFGLGHRLEAAVQVPLTLYQTGDTPAGARAPSLAGLGNLTLGVKGRAVTWRGLGAGAAVLVSIPGGIGKLTHDAGFGGEVRGFSDYHRGRLGIGLSVGFRLRPSTILYDIPVGNELTFAGGASFKLFSRTSVLAEVDGATAAGSPFGNGKQTPVEALAGLRQRIGKLWLTAAGGPGLVDGYGSPTFRVVAGLTWANVPPDSDGDGISDDDDRVPGGSRGRDGFEDSDGCPDPDNDNDGILDAQDKCPNDAEDKDGFEDDDGCPDLDNDDDGILDADDKCPDKPETKNGFEDDDGCPDEKPPRPRQRRHPRRQRQVPRRGRGQGRLRGRRRLPRPRQRRRRHPRRRRQVPDRAGDHQRLRGRRRLPRQGRAAGAPG